MGVLKSYRNMGVGFTLLAKCINDMLQRNINEVVLDVHSDRLMGIVKKTCKSHGILYDIEECFNYLHKFEERNKYEQLMLPGLD
ncbi:GNAT family N-acetyltransferase [Schnuerera ultunensis]|uniref:N-acetyltransferase domain-containing protein n=1 Tax=[Clostridium] ultunense Esp TaxID=1288971 RepID=A0A1M4PJE9_9FIRM|nr:GNAT family N-acetyltransferase [Schnuerera ultunensis]SHD75594.1 conserved protein of unknown function [[Clostridium] ultunense Esp]